MKRIFCAVLFLISFHPVIARADAPVAYEYAAGDVTLSFAFSTKVSKAARPDGLDFKDQQGAPDNCQVFVRIEGELWEFKMRFSQIPLAFPARYKGPDVDHLVRQEDAGMPPGYLAWFLGGMWYDEVGRKLYDQGRRPG